MNADLLSKVEAIEWLRSGVMPSHFRERVEYFVEFYQCPNCDGRQDMNHVLRMWDEEEPSWCPFCVEVPRNQETA